VVIKSWTLKAGNWGLCPLVQNVAGKLQHTCRILFFSFTCKSSGSLGIFEGGLPAKCSVKVDAEMDCA